VTVSGREVAGTAGLREWQVEDSQSESQCSEQARGPLQSFGRSGRYWSRRFRSAYFRPGQRL